MSSAPATGPSLRWAAALLLVAGCATTTLPAPEERRSGYLSCSFDPAREAASMRALIAQGTELHDRGDAVGAMTRFRQALLAALRFLALEPSSPRALRVAAIAVSLMDAGIDPTRSTEGDFSTASMALGGAVGNGDAASRQRQLAVLAELLEKQLPSDASFTLRASAPFLVAAHHQGLLEPICQLLAAPSDGAARAWVNGNGARLDVLRGFARGWRP